jgi:hypothetical protein
MAGRYRKDIQDLEGPKLSTDIPFRITVAGVAHEGYLQPDTRLLPSGVPNFIHMLYKVQPANAD